MKNTYIFFDAVGTLIYPDPPVFETYHKIGKKMGYKLPIETVSKNFILAHNQYFNLNDDSKTNEKIEKKRWQNVVNKTFNSKSTPELFNELWLHFSKPEHWQVFDDTSIILIKLYKQRYHIGIASNFDNRLLKICNNHFPFIKDDIIFYSTKLGFSKPSLKFFKAIQNQFNKSDSRFLMIGDDKKNDIDAAKKAGWMAIHRAKIKTLYSILKN